MTIINIRENYRLKIGRTDGGDLYIKAEVKDYRGWRYAHHYSLVPKSVEAEFKKAINYEVIS